MAAEKPAVHMKSSAAAPDNKSNSGALDPERSERIRSFATQRVASRSSFIAFGDSDLQKTTMCTQIMKQVSKKNRVLFITSGSSSVAVDPVPVGCILVDSGGDADSFDRMDYTFRMATGRFAAPFGGIPIWAFTNTANEGIIASRVAQRVAGGLGYLISLAKNPIFCRQSNTVEIDTEYSDTPLLEAELSAFAAITTSLSNPVDATKTAAKQQAVDAAIKAGASPVLYGVAGCTPLASKLVQTDVKVPRSF